MKILRGHARPLDPMGQVAPRAAFFQDKRDEISIVIQRNRLLCTGGDFCYSRQRSAAAQNFANESRFLIGDPIDIRGWIVGRREPQAHGHDILGIEAGCNQEHE